MGHELFVNGKKLDTQVASLGDQLALLLDILMRPAEHLGHGALLTIAIVTRSASQRLRVPHEIDGGNVQFGAITARHSQAHARSLRPTREAFALVRLSLTVEIVGQRDRVLVNGHDAKVGSVALRRRVSDVGVANESEVVLEAGQVAFLASFRGLPPSIGHTWVRVDLRTRLTALVVEAVATGQLVRAVFWTPNERFVFIANSVYSNAVTKRIETF